MANVESRLVQPVQVQGPSLRAVETFIENYKPLTEQDIRDLDKKSYVDFRKAFVADPVKMMVEASDVGMSLGQYGNLISPETYTGQNRSVLTRVMEDEHLFVNGSDIAAPALVEEFLVSPHRKALLAHLVSSVWDKNTVQDRNSIQLPTSSPLHTPPNVTTGGLPVPVTIGLPLNPGELVATQHSISTNTYSPFRWDYDVKDMQRTKVKVGETIPASTLGESDGNIPMSKWGNRFVLPYEMLGGGQGMRVNKLAQMIALDAAAESTRQFTELVKIYQDGDGIKDASDNELNAAKVEGISTYGGTAGTFGFVPYLNWLDESMPHPFQISHVLMLKANQRQLRSALAGLQGNLALEQLNSVGLGAEMMNMEGQHRIRYGRAPAGSLTADYVLGVDARYGMEKVNRAGMTIRQQAENIANQTREVVVSDTYLWARLAKDAARILNIAG